ncbi:hypothetical protein PoB_002349100 [Plakobranchus ocellatus]|uniref:Uncharacterized protein n=1 Tax=Plakobranchus ocellatus TaxID=259542 RepID=A0AAV3ZR47_9GAST|nr:hypothetical protein PoB_002349100 [Plakobranchus ocellatus]
MASKLTDSQRIRLDREILTSGVTSLSRSSTRHKNAAEQTLLEQRLNDLDLLRRRSIQSISEQERKLLSSYKAHGMKRHSYELTARTRRKIKGDTNTRDKVSETALLLQSSDERGNSYQVCKNHGRDQHVKINTKRDSVKSFVGGSKETSGLYDAYFEFTPEFLRKEYEEEENAKKTMKAGLHLDQPPYNEAHFSSLGIPQSFREFSPRQPTRFPQHSSEVVCIPKRRRALSLQITSGHLLPERNRHSLANEISRSNCRRLPSANGFMRDSTRPNQHNVSAISCEHPDTNMLQREVVHTCRPGPLDFADDSALRSNTYNLALTNRRVLSSRQRTRLSERGDVRSLPTHHDHDNKHAVFKAAHNPILSTNHSGFGVTTGAVTSKSPSPKIYRESSPWLQVCMDTDERRGENHVNHMRRRSICTDRVIGQSNETSHEGDDRVPPWEELDTPMDHARQQRLKNKAKDNRVLISDGANQNIRGDRRRNSYSSNLFSTSKTSQPQSPSEAFVSNRNSNIRGNTTMDGTGENNSKNGDRRKGSAGRNSRKNSFAESNRSDNAAEILRKNSFAENSRRKRSDEMSEKRSIGESSRKGSDSYNHENMNVKTGRRSSMNCSSRKNSVCDLNSTIEDTVQQDIDSKRDSTKRDNSISADKSSRKNSLTYHCSIFADDSNRENSIHGVNSDRNDTIHDFSVNSSSNDSFMSRSDEVNSSSIVMEKTSVNPLAAKACTKFLLEASAKQLLSTLRKSPEDNKATPTEEDHGPEKLDSTTPRSCENDTPYAETHDEPHKEATGVSLRATSTNPRRPSGGNFFLVANALKSGQPLAKLNFRSDRPNRIPRIPVDHPCAIRDYKDRNTSVKRLAGVHAILQNSAVCMVEEEKERKLNSVNILV